MTVKKGWGNSIAKNIPRKSPLFGKVNIDANAFDNLILAQGVRIRIFRSVMCPNIKDIATGDHEIDCALCLGSQFLDRSPLETRAVIQSVQSQTEHLIEGLYDGNTISITLPAGVEAQYFTMIELMDFTELYNQRVSRQHGQTDIMKYPAIHVNLMIDKHGREYFQGSDFDLDLNGNVCWRTNKGPLPETIYSIHYETKVRYRTIRSMHTNRFGTITKGNVDIEAKLPEMWLASRVFLVDRRDAQGNPMPQNSLPVHTIENDNG